MRFIATTHMPPLRALEVNHLPQGLRRRTETEVVLSLIYHDVGRLFVAYETPQGLKPTGQLLRSLADALSYPTKDECGMRRRIFWDHEDIPFMFEMTDGGWDETDDNGNRHQRVPKLQAAPKINIIEQPEELREVA